MEESRECAELRVKVYYEDTDAGGVVYHANYLRYMERARVEWLAERGFGQRVLADRHHVAFVVRGIDVSYREPARLEDVLVVRTKLVETTPIRLRLRQEVFLEAKATPAVTAQVEVVCVDPVEFRPTRIPAIVAERLCESAPSPTSATAVGPSTVSPVAAGVIERADDVEELAELNQRLLVEERYDRTFGREELVRRMREFLATIYDAYFIMDGKRVAGYALVNRSSSPVYIRQFYVKPEFRRRGLGRAAVEALMRIYGSSLDVEVMAWNPLGMHFWTSLGFKHRYNGLRLTT